MTCLSCLKLDWITCSGVSVASVFSEEIVTHLWMFETTTRSWRWHSSKRQEDWRIKPVTYFPEINEPPHGNLETWFHGPDAMQVCDNPLCQLVFHIVFLWLYSKSWLIAEVWGMETKAFELPHDKTNKMTVCQAKTQISLGNRPVWSESSLCTQWVAKDPSFLHGIWTMESGLKIAQILEMHSRDRWLN